LRIVGKPTVGFGLPDAAKADQIDREVAPAASRLLPARLQPASSETFLPRFRIRSSVVLHRNL
jgi:hypothetical protein